MSLTHILQEGGPASKSQAPQIPQLSLQPGIFEFQIARPGGLIYQALFDRGIVYQDAFEQRHGIDISIRALRHRIPVAALVPYLAHFEQTSQGRYFGGWRILNLSFLGRPGMAEAMALCFQSEDRRWKIVAVGLGEHMEGDVLVWGELTQQERSTLRHYQWPKETLGKFGEPSPAWKEQREVALARGGGSRPLSAVDYALGLRGVTRRPERCIPTSTPPGVAIPKLGGNKEHPIAELKGNYENL